MKIILEQHGMRYTVETVNPKQDDFTAQELKDIFSRLMVQGGFSPSVIDLEDDNGHYEYVGGDEIVIKKETLYETE